MEEKIDAIMKALEILLKDGGYDIEANSLYKVRSGYNPDEE